MNQIKLEFRQAIDLRNENLKNHSISFYEYPAPTFENFQAFEDKNTNASNIFFFSIRIFDKKTKKIVQTFVFSFVKTTTKPDVENNLIWLELNFFDAKTQLLQAIEQFNWKKNVQLRSFYFSKNTMYILQFDKNKRITSETENPKLDEVIATFFDEVFDFTVKKIVTT